jgi:hypothetical protein
MDTMSHFRGGSMLIAEDHDDGGRKAYVEIAVHIVSRRG